MKLPNRKCITNGCKKRVHVHSYWMICADYYSNTPEHIPNNQINLYNELQAEKFINEYKNYKNKK